MYREFYGLKEPPFSITPDPRFVFLSERHRDALAHLLYGVGKGGSGGFVQLTGEVGTGKTTLCRLLLEQLPENTHVALLLNPKLSPIELLESVCEELKIDLAGKRGSSKALVDALNVYLLEAYAQGLHIVLIVDEAQSLSIEALEQVRLLTNLETTTQKLLQVILLGQPELRDLLLKPELRQLAQRITARFHLTPLDGEETEAYLRHRMAVAGAQRFPFSRLAVRALHRRAGGVPRLLNVIAERALMAGYARERDVIGERLVSRAADEALATGRAQRLAWRYALPVGLLAAALVGAWVQREHWLAPPAPLPAQAAPQVPAPPALQSPADLRVALQDAHATELIAWTSLLARWQVKSTEVSVLEATRCNMVVFAGLNCLRGLGTLDKLKVLNRPVIMALQGDAEPDYALLLGVGLKEVRFKLAGRKFALTRNDFADYWSGNYLAVWRQPEFVPTNLKRGDAGPAVAWLKQRLDLLDPRPEAVPGPAFFDLGLEQRVRALQVGFGLVPDGIVGPDTLFALAALDEAGPHLEREVP